MDDLDLLEGLPGLRDYYPEDWSKINYILSQMRQISKSYGYEEYEGPSLEAVELIEAKSGEGLIREIFQLSDRNDRRLLLRPEQTPTLAKMLAREQQRYKRPIRWFSIPRLFRDETVQKGRVREFWQLNVDILGESSVVADAEVIAVAVDIIRACGIQDDEFNVYVNHRQLLNNYIASLTDIEPSKIIALIDKKMSFYQELASKKLKAGGLDNQTSLDQALLLRRIANSTGKFRTKLLEELDSKALTLLNSSDELIYEALKTQLMEIGMEQDQTTKLLEFVSITGSADEFFSQLEKLSLPENLDHALSEIRNLKDYLEGFGVLGPVVFDLSMARGLDYYTGIVFEAFDATGEIVRALLGGGRYADLVEILGGSPLEGVGFGMGETVIMELMALKGVFNTIKDDISEIYIAPIKSEPIPHVLRLTQRLRKNFNVLSNPFNWKIGRHFEFADSKGCKLVLLLGKRDIDQNVVSVRILETSEQLTLSLDENLENELQKILQS